MKLRTSGRHRRWARLATMNWDEVATRSRQAISKQVDLALHRLRIDPRLPKLLPTAALGNFFFDRTELPERVSLLRTHLSGEVDEIVSEADEIRDHRFRLLGFGNRDFGAEIDWHFTIPVQPLEPWFKINFLDFHAVGDHKLVWELNRHQHLVTLAKAWLLTGRVDYVTELENQWYSWWTMNPYPLGVNWASSLEVAFRSLSWLWVRRLVAGCPALSDSFEGDLLQMLQLQGWYIDRYLSTYFSPNTHLLGEATALFFLGTLCPQISAAKRWQRLGWTILLQQSKEQVLSDGVYFEQALYYHVYALDFFLHARTLAQKNGVSVPEEFDEVLRKMLNVIHRLSESGSTECFGDDDGGRVFNPRRNQSEHMTDPLGLGAILYGSNEYPAAKLTEESIWLFGEAAVRTHAKPSAPSVTTSTAFPSAGIYLINDAFPCPQQMRIDAGPQGTGNSGHGHADALNICLSLDGKRVLVDSGTHCYVSPDRKRDHFRATAAHNTLAVDHLDQAVPEGPFAWSSIPHVAEETWLNGRTFDFFIGSHDGYTRLPKPVLHRRSVFHIKGGLWVVRDVAEGEGEHFLQCAWHFAPGMELSEECGQTMVRFTAPGEGVNPIVLGLLTHRGSQWKVEAGEGFVSPAYGAMQRAPVLRTYLQTALPNDVAVLLVPMPEESGLKLFDALDEDSTNGVRGYRYQTNHTTEFFFFAHSFNRWNCGSWAGDSQFLYSKWQHGLLTHVVMIRGTFAEWQGKRLVNQPSRPEVMEWSEETPAKQSFSWQY